MYNIALALFIETESFYISTTVVKHELKTKLDTLIQTLCPKKDKTQTLTQGPSLVQVHQDNIKVKKLGLRYAKVRIFQAQCFRTRLKSFLNFFKLFVLIFSPLFGVGPPKPKYYVLYQGVK